MATQQRLEIVGGDPKEKLMAQLSDIGRFQNAHQRPDFVIEIKLHDLRIVPVTVWINGLEAEDGSGNRWLISGYINPVCTTAYPQLKSHTTFQGYYDTRARNGWLKPHS